MALIIGPDFKILEVVASVRAAGSRLSRRESESVLERNSAEDFYSLDALQSLNCITVSKSASKNHEQASFG